METSTTHAAPTSQLAQAGARELLVFGLGREEYAIDIGLVQEIRGYGAVTRIANAPAFLKGFIHLRGSIVPLADLRIALGQAEPAYDASTVVIILIFAQGATGIVVDRVADVVPLAPAQLKAPPRLDGSAMAGHVTAIGTLDERMLIVLDMASLLAGMGMHAGGKLAA
ncbi:MULTISPECIES: chemotaxis protein CheW [unclassified Janthinobacterium]|uniref:chemotaxis protein CheW n=1 Tax=unclassified Janthinobacterium TaxID=2610881 RepID=UPI00088890E8|nr:MULTISPECIES: chemotaxis protein CheW [unclassified Janthinobacterium]SDA55055.1 purine-binding chemotaxis protein CheW [Janthinobacterium sp. 551a]SFB46629.1 purine-binding chemotaxis protein CheW [Janthinobacterium sp. 344]